MSSNTPVESAKPPGRPLSIVGAVLGLVGIVIAPIVLGPVGAVLGFVAYSKGDKPVGLYVGIGCIVATVAGVVLAALLLSSTN